MPTESESRSVCHLPALALGALVAYMIVNGEYTSSIPWETGQRQFYKYLLQLSVDKSMT